MHSDVSKRYLRIEEAAEMIGVSEEDVVEIENKAESQSIEEFAKIVGYEYHKGEYKSFSNEEDKCYVAGKYETTTFYLNENQDSSIVLGQSGIFK